TPNNEHQQRVSDAARSPYQEPDDPLLLPSCEEVQAAINNEKDKSPGEDGISANIIKRISKIFPRLFYNLFRKCFQLRFFPSRWKLSIIKLIKKANGRYRPISLLNVMGKIYEK